MIDFLRSCCQSQNHVTKTDAFKGEDQQRKPGDFGNQARTSNKSSTVRMEITPMDSNKQTPPIKKEKKISSVTQNPPKLSLKIGQTTAAIHGFQSSSEESNFQKSNSQQVILDQDPKRKRENSEIPSILNQIRSQKSGSRLQSEKYFEESCFSSSGMPVQNLPCHLAEAASPKRVFYSQRNLEKSPAQQLREFKVNKATFPRVEIQDDEPTEKRQKKEKASLNFFPRMDYPNFN